MIRKAIYNDICAINNLGRQLFDNFEKIYDIINYIQDENYIIYVNEEENINGLLIAYNNYETIELECIVVDSKCRNNGIGTKLFDFLLHNASADIERIYLEVSEINKVAIKFYQRNGFKIINVRKKYYKNNDALIMEKKI